MRVVKTDYVSNSLQIVIALPKTTTSSALVLLSFPKTQLTSNVDRICSAPSLGIREECVYFPLGEQEIHALFQRDYQLQAASRVSLITKLFSGRCAANGASWGGPGLALGKSVVIATQGGGENMDKVIASRRVVCRLSRWLTRSKTEAWLAIKGHACDRGLLPSPR